MISGETEISSNNVKFLILVITSIAIVLSIIMAIVVMKLPNEEKKLKRLRKRELKEKLYG